MEEVHWFPFLDFKFALVLLLNSEDLGWIQEFKSEKEGKKRVFQKGTERFDLLKKLESEEDLFSCVIYLNLNEKEEF